MPCCLVGKHSQINDIDAMLRAGEGVRAVARVYQLSKTGVAEHRRRCLRLEAAPLSAVNVGSPMVAREPPEKVAAGDRSAVSGQRPDSERPGVEAEVRATEPEVIEVSGQVVEECPDTESPLRLARAMLAPTTIDDDEEPSIETNGQYQKRVFHIADMISRGEYLGRPTVKALMAEWGLTYQTVRGYARAAACVCKADRGDIEQVREVSIGAWTDMRDQARDKGDWKAAAAAQAGLDRAAGVVEPGGPRVQINVLQDPGVKLVMEALRNTWQRLHPHTLPEADAAIRAVMFGRGAPPRGALGPK